MSTLTFYSLILIESLVFWSILVIPLLFVLDKSRKKWDTFSRYHLLIFCFYCLPIAVSLFWLKYYAPTLVSMLASESQPVKIQLSSITVGNDIAQQQISLTILEHSLQIAFMVWLVSAMFGVYRYLRSWSDTRKFLKQHAQNLITPESVSRKSGLPITFFPKRLKIVEVSNSKGPGIYGYFNPVLILPSSLLNDQKPLQLTVIHELTHYEYRDSLYLHFENFIKAIFWIHPIIHRLFKEIQLERELRCDKAVLEKMPNQSYEYAKLLTQQGQKSYIPLTAAVSSNKSVLMQRIEAIAAVSKPSIRRSSATAYLPYLLVLPIIIGMNSYRFEIAEDSSRQIQVNSNLGNIPIVEGELIEEIFIVTEESPQLIGGMQSIASKLVYPQKAKERGIEGRVFLEFVIDKEGKTEHIKVTKSLSDECDKAAIEAIKQARFVPAKQRGRTVKSLYSVPIIFKL